MEILCTRPSCGSRNHFADLDDANTLKTTQQKFCTQCGMPLILGGRYLPTQLLGQGGFGAAFLACDRYTTSLRNCVVKQFQPAGNLSAQQLEIAQGLFEREAAVLEDLGREHRQIPDSFAFFPLVIPDRQGNKDEQFFYLVQEFIDGQDLEHELAAKGNYSEAEMLEVLREILNVLSFVHGRGVIHRDIKPSNIMRTTKGRLYLLDFGAVKQVTAGSAGSGHSTGIYSMGFAPPEQMQGSQVYPSTDLYALGATCLVLVTGKASDQLFDTYNNCWTWREHAPQVGDRTAAILEKMLRPTPKDRFQSADDVLLLLNHTPAARSSPTPAPPPPPVAPASQSTVTQAPPAPAPNLAQPGPPPAPIPPTPAPSRRSTPKFGLVEILASSAFTGFEGALLLMISISLVNGITPISIGLWGMSMGGLIYAQSRRALEKWDFAILGGITVALVRVVPWFHRSAALQAVLTTLSLSGVLGYVFLAVLAGAVVVLVTALFRLIYQILSSML
ncbi:protein kinase domain-containing protein [Spirulina major]|uniref:protein kinase domain-containing protein n=1 Tax=Spirulina major TaxID=270636 RepID=UPI000932A231|nr:serine/threonine-protein kinase [Spirulina major]